MEGGGTYAVTATIGEVILANERASCDSSPKAHSTLLFVMLNEIDKDHSEGADMVDTSLRAITSS